MSAKAEIAAAEVLLRYGIAAPEDIDLEAVCWGENLLATEGPIASADAWLVTSGEYGLARVRTDIPYVGQKRFALAHELGHWLLHEANGQTWYDNDQTLNDYKRDPREIEANGFASSLLVPMPMLQVLFGDAAPLSLALSLQIAETFNVGPIVSARRMVAMENVNALLLACDDERVLYFCRSSRCTISSVVPGIPVPDGPTREAARNIGVLYSAMVEARSWAPNAKPHFRYREEAYRPSLDSPVLTLLTWPIR